MKKLLLLLFVSVALSSCSSNTDEADIIVGTWGLFSLNNVEVSDCEKMSTLTFNADGSAVGTNFMVINNTCSQSGVNDVTTWMNNGNGSYVIAPGTANSVEWNITFSDGNNTLNITNQGVVYKRQ